MHSSDLGNHKLVISVKEEYSSGLFSGKPQLGQVFFLFLA